jgi:CDP-diacylglycerol--serine O-phosphatidyltransferase
MIRRYDIEDPPREPEDAHVVEQRGGTDVYAAADGPEGLGGPGQRVRRRILQSTALLPVMLTLANGLLGFGAIHFATKDDLGTSSQGNLVVAAWLIVGAMVCDMLDGQVARLTGQASEFGAQLDSLCDAISFGAAPAVLMLRAALVPLREVLDYVPVERLIWAVAALYLAGAVLRLARFNVEHPSEGSSAHLAFQGLPSPAAAASVVSLVLLHADLAASTGHGRLLAVAFACALPAVTLLAGLLMVSRIPYAHLVNRLVARRRPLDFIVRAILVAMAVVVMPFVAAAVLAIGFMLSGLLRKAAGALRPTSRP